ncbi:MAG: lysoplasmalogenase [Chloroflexi bacterium]|nr:lysoplasmalogenase [Chloroflexota bacterium]
MPTILLFLFQLILFAIGIIGPWRDANATGRLPRIVRMLLSFSLVVAAFEIWFGGAKQATYAQWVAFGMLASFIGDLIMAKLIPLPNRLIGGMIAFGIAHVFYITAYVGASVESLDRWIVGLVVGLGFYAVISIGGWFALIRNPQKDRATNIGALVYGMLVGTMAAFALGLASALGGGFWLTAVGGLLFIVSDFIIGITDIRGIKIKNANDWIWLTYVAGQAGIIYAGAIY